MLNGPGPKDLSIYGSDLKSAAYQDAVKVAEEYEKYSFNSFQQVGYRWTPTRQMLLEHIVTYVNEAGRLRSSIGRQWILIIVQSIAIILLALR